ncbi:hypothetical protein [Chitinophaga filiformis]|uniref:Holin-X, holin superfamily III n=1 Tax=Chitinophaga filiformis TaxID=104663 RepID=A0ABY4I3L2_CHIFI|nr:hypothetical protein [Chitinophaga filiformis]UPK70684.1 hypothetical protein MYF79_05155 [Chitinophaga filiformis]
MPKSFYDLDYDIEVNEKRDASLKEEYDKILGKVSNILIVYSGVSVFLIAICKDFFTPPVNGWYLLSLGIFVLCFIISFAYTILFLYPKNTPVLAPPKEYYTDLRSQLEAALPTHPAAPTQAEKEQIDVQLKTAYITELEDAIDINTDLVTKKQAHYFKAFKFAIFCIFPFFVCMVFHLLKPDEPTSVKIVDSNKSSILVIDTVKVLEVSSHIDSTLKSQLKANKK